MKAFYNTLKLALGAAVLWSSAGCVASRDVRNGVFDENQYIRKSTLIDPVNEATLPPWILQGTVLQVSTPNPLAALNFFPGSPISSTIFKFAVLSDKMQMVSQRALYAGPDSSRTDDVINAWPITNVDLKFRVNLDGETTNFYEENQELPWEQRQWVKVTLAKNDLSDLAVLDSAGITGTGGYITDALRNCVDFGNSSSTLVPDSMIVDDAHSYLSWKIQVTMPLTSGDAVCTDNLTKVGLVDHNTITATLMYSMTRMQPLASVTYKPLAVDEKDPIRRKYAFFNFLSAGYTPRTPVPDATGDDPNLAGDGSLLAAQQFVQRFDPQKNIVYYLDPQMPDKFKNVLRGPNGVADQTNAILAKAGVPGRLSFLEANDGLPDGQVREFGDVRFSYVRWVLDPDTNPGLLGEAGPFVTDPRTGETLKAAVTIFDQGTLNQEAYQVDYLLQTLGASEGLFTQDDNGNAVEHPWTALAEPCKNGDYLKPEDSRIVQAGYISTHHNQSTLFNKIQQYLNKPASLYGNLSPSDFVGGPDPAFKDVYFDLLPQFVFSDPAANQFVTPEAGTGVFGPSTSALWAMRTQELELQKVLGAIDQGFDPYTASDDAAGLTNATTFVNHLRDLRANHEALRVADAEIFNRYRDFASPYPLYQAYAQMARRCVDHAWETRTQWLVRYSDEVLARTIWHEFGHSLGLLHNFMASVDERNWPTYQDESGTHYVMQASSVMDYSSLADNSFATSVSANGPAPGVGWGPYDAAALAWGYGNDAKDGDSSYALGTLSTSGQFSATKPWKDPYGFRADATEINYLRCDDLDVARSPMCQQFDWGSNPSQITAEAIDEYDWRYNFRNLRSFYKFKSFANYGTSIATSESDSRRFITFAQTVGGVGDIIRKLKIPPPSGVPQETWIGAIQTQLFDAITSGSTQSAALHKAIIQEAAAERPFSTSVDQRFGDVNIQGIEIDKVMSAQGWLGLSPVTNQDPNVTGRYSAPYTEFVSSNYVTVAADTLDTVLGGSFDTYPWLIQSNIALFAQDSHSQNFNANFSQYREWIGLQAFTREADFLAYFQDAARAAQLKANDPVTGLPIDCTSEGAQAGTPCNFDLRNFSGSSQVYTFPDGHNWRWIYLRDRNAWMAADRDRNPVTYRRMGDYITQLATGDEGNDLYQLERPLLFYYDAYVQYR